MDGEIAKFWLTWFHYVKNVQALKGEIETLNRQIEMERQYPYKGEKALKVMIRKKILLQSKIRMLEAKEGYKEWMRT
jgi:hypothetical protein